ncbi:MAG: nucleotide exchange factor GrpE [Thermoplasmata archaeon]
MTSDGEPRDNQTAERPPAGTVPLAAGEDTEGSLEWEVRFKYLLADFDNFRRRTERDRAGVRAEVEANLLRRFIPLVEGFQNAEAAGKSLPTSDPLRRGLELLGHELDAFLRSVAFAPVARIGEPFRPEEHEAVGESVGPRNISDGAVAEIVQQGYRFQGGLLRPAKVLVARTASGAEAPSAPPPEPGSKNPPASVVEEGAA